MNSSIWLPDAALGDGRVFDWIVETCTQWAEAWLPAGMVTSCTEIDDTRKAGAISRNALGASLMVEDDNRTLLAEALIGHRLSAKHLRPADKSLMSGLVDAALDDCLDRLAVHGDRPAGNIGSSSYTSVGLSLNGQPLFQISLSSALVTQTRRALCAVPDALSRIPVPVGDAIGGAEIALSAEVGSLSMSLDEISALSLGDVFVFDQTLDQAFPLLADGQKCPGLAARYVLTEAANEAAAAPGLILEQTQ